MRINTNVAALNAWRNLSSSDETMAKSLERLSSGARISKASDDAAGLAISEKMKGQIGGLKMAQRNAQDGISMIQTAEGGLAESASILLRMRDLANQATNGTLEAGDRSKITEEFGALKTELSRISSTTKFNNIALLGGGLGGSVSNVGTGIGAANGVANIETLGAAAGSYTLSYDDTANTMTLTDGTTSETISTVDPTGFNTTQYTFSKLNVRVTVNANLSADITANNTFDVTSGTASIQIGANGSTTVDVDIDDMSANGLGLAAAGVDSTTNATTAVSLIDTAIGAVNTQRAKLGALQNRLEHTIANLGNSIENLTSAESRIKDVDMAIEMSSFTKGQILQQAGTAMLAQANQRPQSVMQLLRG